MKIRFNVNPDGEPHIHDHGVTEEEVHEALSQPLLEASGRDDSTILFGRTLAGRVLKIIYTTARDGGGIFIVTAYELPAKQLRTLKRRLRRRRSR